MDQVILSEKLGWSHNWDFGQKEDGMWSRLGKSRILYNDNVDDHKIVERKTIEAKDQLLKNWNSMHAYCGARLIVTQYGKDGEG